MASLLLYHALSCYRMTGFLIIEQMRRLDQLLLDHILGHGDHNEQIIDVDIPS